MIQANRLSDQVYRHLLAEILSGRMAAGSILNEVELAARLSVSRTPIREAITRLTATEVAEVRANKSAVVRPFGAEQLRQIYQVRECMEGLAAELACPNITDDDLRRLDQLVQMTIAAGIAQSPETCHQLDTELHRTIARRSGNEILAREIERFHDIVQMMRERLANRANAVEDAFHDHERIIGALRAGDPARARQEMINHIRSSGRFAIDTTENAATADLVPSPSGSRSVDPRRKLAVQSSR